MKLYNATDYTTLASLTVGANPDSVIYTPDGSRLLVANEAEPSPYIPAVGSIPASGYGATPSADPVGSVSIINTSTYGIQTAGFESFNAQAATLKSSGVRLTGPNASVAQDLEPEYIAVSADGTKAYATLQEANSVAIIDVATATVTGIKALGLKDHSLAGNGLDVSDRDGTGTTVLNGNIQNWNVMGMYMPDGIANFTNNGNQFYVTANEGDSRADWGTLGNDEIRVGLLLPVQIDSALNASLTAAHGADWQTNNDKLNRLTVSLTSGDTDGDGDLDQLQVFGSRSFSILDANGNQVFDSGDKLEQIIKASYPTLWDDTRSDNKGPEPEGAVMGKVNDRDLLFLGLERSNAVMIWDLTDLADVKFIDMLFAPGDVGPEGLSFFSNSAGSFLAVSNEISETTSLFKVSAVPVPSAVWLFGTGLIGLLGSARKRKSA